MRSEIDLLEGQKERAWRLGLDAFVPWDPSGGPVDIVTET